MRSLFPLLLIASPAVADAPTVVADIAPVHSLVARVMDGVGTPALLLPPGASPHGYSMRPSEARALSEAELVFWIGEGLTPWLHDPIEALAEDAHVITLQDVEGLTVHAYEEGEHHDHGDEHKDEAGHEDHDDHEHEEASDHDHDHDHGDDHGDEHEEHAHDEHGHDDEHAEDHAEHGHEDEEHGHKEDAHAGHDHGEFDPHMWLHPENAVAWLDHIAEELSEHDPENAEVYEANAAAGKAQIESITSEMEAQLESVADTPFVVLHDGYGYLVERFDLNQVGAVSDGEAQDPSPSALREVQEMIREEGVRCLFAEPQLDARLLETALEGQEGEIATLDLLGASFEPGAELYTSVLSGLAASLTDCLGKDPA